MSDERSNTLLEEVLFAFSVEPQKDRATFERYLKLYPQFAGDLIDLMSELRFPGREPGYVHEEEEAFQRAWSELSSIAPMQSPVAHASDLFASFRGPAFASLAKKLRIPRSVLMALRDRLVIASSIPELFLARLIRAMGATKESVLAYLDQPPIVAPAASYKSDQKPEATTKITFEQILADSSITPDQRNDIYTSSD